MHQFLTFAPMYKFLKKVLPGGLKDKANSYVVGQMKQKRMEVEARIPKVDLSARHIANLRNLLTREDLLALMPKDAVVAEMGVDHGDFSEKILSICSPRKLHLIDVWATERYHDGLAQLVNKKFKTHIESGQVEINRGYSTTVVNDFQADYFDWIYIDTDHTYQTTADELKMYAPKMKKGGIMAGHDFVMGNWETGFRYGVIEAVYEFCAKEDWELIYLTMEMENNPSFAIRKI